MGRVGGRLNSLLLREVPALRLRLGRDDKIDETNPRSQNRLYPKPVPIAWTMSACWLHCVGTVGADCRHMFCFLS